MNMNFFEALLVALLVWHGQVYLYYLKNPMFAYEERNADLSWAGFMNAFVIGILLYIK